MLEVTDEVFVKLWSKTWTSQTPCIRKTSRDRAQRARFPGDPHVVIRVTQMVTNGYASKLGCFWLGALYQP